MRKEKPLKVRVRMTGTTVWTIRPGDEISIDQNMARRWERGKLAVIVVPEQKTDTGSLEHITRDQLVGLAKEHGLTVRGTKPELAERILTHFVLRAENPEERPGDGPEDDLESGSESGEGESELS